jgi:hypothetical protein
VTVFVSYARQDQAAVEQLCADIERGRRRVWMDRELTGGDEWWTAILRQIRECELVVLALSPDFLDSRFCEAELRYAETTRRPLLPVMIRDIDLRLAPPAVANLHIIDYRHRDPESVLALRDALDVIQPPPVLPDPLPPEPPSPTSHLHGYLERLTAPSLRPDEQARVYTELRHHLFNADPSERAAVLSLLVRLRSRADLIVWLAADIDHVLAAVRPRPVPPPPGTARFSREAFTWLVVATVFSFGVIGIIVGALNARLPARRTQALYLLWGGIAWLAWFVLSLTLGSITGER